MLRTAAAKRGLAQWPFPSTSVIYTEGLGAACVVTFVPRMAGTTRWDLGFRETHVL